MQKLEIVEKVRQILKSHGGYELKLGDHLNGYKAEGNVDTAAEIASWFDARAHEHVKGYESETKVDSTGHEQVATPEGNH